MKRNQGFFSAFEHFHEPLLVFDTSARLVYLNRLAGRCLKTTSDMAGKSWSEVFEGTVPAPLRGMTESTPVPPSSDLWQGGLRFRQSCAGSVTTVQVRCSPWMTGETLSGILMTIIERFPEKLSGFLTEGPAVLFRWRPDVSASVEFVSENIRQFGYQPQAFLADTLSYADIIHPADRDRAIRQTLEQADQGMDTIQNRYRIVTQSGELCWVDDHTVVERDSAGRVIVFNGYILDVTAQVEMDRRLGQQQEWLSSIVSEHTLLRTIIDAIPDHIYLKDRQGRLIVANQSSAAFTGMKTPQDMIGKTDFDFHPPGMAKKLFAEEQQIMETGEPVVNREMCFPDQTDPNRLIWLSITKIPLRDYSGKVVGLACHNRIITRQKEFEQAVIEERNLLRSILEAIPDAIYVKDRASRFVLTNSEALKQLGLSDETQALGKTDYDFFPGENVSSWTAQERSILENGQGLINQYRLVAGDHLLVTQVPLIDTRNRIIGLIGINRDISELKLMEATLQQRLKLEEMVRKVSQQMAEVSLAEVEQGVKRALALIGESVQADHAALLFQDTGSDRMILHHEWVRSGISSHQPRFERIARTESTLLQKCLQSLEPCQFSGKYQEFPNCSLVSWLGVTSLALVPLTLHRNPLGILLIDQIAGNEGWSAEDLSLFRVAGEIMIGALERKRQYDRLMLERNLLQTMMDTTPDLFFAKDTASRFLFLNRSEAQSLGITDPAGALNKTDFEFFPKESAELFFQQEQKIITSGTPLLNQEEYHPDERVFLTTKVPLKDSAGRIIGLVGSCRDITEWKKNQDRIWYLSFHDTLTGLYNRAFLEEEIRRLESDRQIPLTVMIIDVNGLKLANDAFGHQEGDRLLCRMADQLRTCCRKEDLIARWGGDEFLILLPQAQQEVACEVANRIQKACQEEKSHPVRMSVAIGHATRLSPAQTIDQVIATAEERMYRNKLTASRKSRRALIASLEETLRQTTLETADHARRVGKIARAIGLRLSLSDAELRDLEALAQLHDLGMIVVPREILQKPGSLSSQELTIIKKHPETGYRIAQGSSDLAPIAEGILCHHERWDGSGYPQSIAGERIPLISRIVALADSVDAMLQGRSYQAPRSYPEVVLEIRRERGKQFDPRVADGFLSLPKSTWDDG